MEREIPDDASNAALDRVMTALTELFAAQVSHLRRETAVALCQEVENGRLGITFDITMSPAFTVVCGLRRGEEPREVLFMVGGGHKVGFLEKDRAPN